MNIKTKYDVGDLTLRKYDRNENQIVVCEIIEILPVVCVAGPQVFYLTRPIVLSRRHDYEKAKKVYIWTVERAIIKDNTYTKFREDELVPISKEASDILKGE